MADATTHTLQEIIEKTIQTTLLKAHPVGSYWLTESDDDPSTLFGGGVGACQGQAPAMLGRHSSGRN